MTLASAAFHYTPPILVLGLGNVQCGDDGFGPALLKELATRYRYAGGFVEFVDGGTKGLGLLRSLAGRQALVVLDAVSSGKQPGTVSVLSGTDVLRFAHGRSASVYEGNAGELLATAAFLGDLPDHCYIVGVQPANLDARTGFSSDVENAIQSALTSAQDVVDGLLVELAESVHA